MYAIIQTGGKQYKVQSGDTIKVEKLIADIGTTHIFDNVLALNTENGLTLGNPIIQGAKVSATVVSHEKSKKIIVYKFKKKKGFHKKKGHRQPYTELKVDQITT